MARYSINDFEYSQDPDLKDLQERFINGQIRPVEAVKLGRDKTEMNFMGYQCKPDYAYRAVNKKGLESYLEAGEIFNPGDDYVAGENNSGVDWFLGAVGTRYAKKDCFIIECPADQEFFVPTICQLAIDPRVKHLKSGSQHQIPLKYCKIMSVSEMQNGNYEDVKAELYPYEEYDNNQTQDYLDEEEYFME